MAYVTIKGTRHNVRIMKDLGENWSLEVYPEPSKGFKAFEPFKNWPTPLCLKILADSKEDALQSGLEHMKKLGQIDEFHLEPNERPAPPPPPPAKPAPKPAEAKPAAAPGDAKPAAKPVEAKPATPPGDAKPAAKPAETNSAAAPADSKPAPSPAEPKP
jgi:hypothetical protein